MKKEKNNKKPFNVLSKKGLMTLALAGVMVASPFMLAGCSDGQDGKDGKDGTNGPQWHYSTVDVVDGTLSGDVDFTAVNGDFYIDTDSYILYQLKNGSWAKVMENYGKPGTTPQAPSAPVITINQEGYWCVDGTSTGVKAEVTDGISSYTHIRYAIDINGAEMTETWQLGYNYIGFAITNSETAPTDMDEYKWAQFINEDNKISEETSKLLDVSKLEWLDNVSLNESTGQHMDPTVANSRAVMDTLIRVQPGDSIKLIENSGYKFIPYVYTDPQGGYEANNYFDANLEDSSSGLGWWGTEWTFNENTTMKNGKTMTYPAYIKLLIRVDDTTNTTFTVEDVKDLFEFNISADNSHLYETEEDNKIVNNITVAPEFLNTNLIAHRGLCTSAPENTMSAVKEAYKAGMKIVEVDIHMTKDNIPVLLHDATIDRTSTGTGSISNMTLEEARQYTYGNGKTGYENEQLATLQEFLAYCKARNILCELDLADRNFTSTQKKIIYDTVASMGMLDKTMFTATSSELLSYLGFNRNIIICIAGITSLDIAQQTLPYFEDYHLVYASVPIANMDQELIAYIHTLGLRARVWTINKANTTQFENAINWGVDLIVSDDMTKLFDEE